MEALIIESTKDTPAVCFDPSNNLFEITGKSMPEDVNSFYGQVFEWLDKYFENPNDKTAFVFKYKYFNTASSKIILDILFKLDEEFEEGVDVKILWHSLEADDDMIEAGEEYSELVEIPFEFETYSRS